MLTDVPGVRVGHVTDAAGRTGVTAVLLPAGSIASGEVRGGAPGTREFDLLAPERAVGRVDAVLLCGGSAFGLAACDGALRWCEEHGRGVATPGGRVPIVVGAVIFDLAEGDPSARPDADAGYAACAAAACAPAGTGAVATGRVGGGTGAVATGRVGGGTGATVGHLRGAPRPGGVGCAAQHAGELVVAALMVVNAFGDRYDLARELDDVRWPDVTAGTMHTTIGVVATNARLEKTGCLLVAETAHHGIARAIEPSHTLVDGDAIVAASCGSVQAPLEQVRTLAGRAVTTAILSVLDG
ncbi:MAG: P1 family peptidase [Solirubrobacterales bacterium]|nr:P1 family peptidase [Solirubrobacterales bacterium]